MDKFKLWVELRKREENTPVRPNFSEDEWIANMFVHDLHIYNKLFFIKGINVKTHQDNDEIHSQQCIPFNKLLMSDIRTRLFGKDNYIIISQCEACELNSALHHSGFKFGVGLISLGSGFSRYIFSGTQEEISEQVDHLLRFKNLFNWLKK